MPSLETYDTFQLGKTAKLIPGSPTAPVKIFNAHGEKIFFKNTAAVSSSDTEVAVGSSVTGEENLWIISAGESTILVEHLPTGVFSGGLISASAVPGFFAGEWNPTAATSGTDTTPAEKKLFVSSLFLPINKKVKGIGYLVGSVGGTNKAVAGLFSATGKVLGKTTETTEGTTVGTAAEVQELNLTAEVTIPGPAVYFIGITMNGGTARLRSIPKNTAGNNVFTAELTLSEKNKLAEITPPTSFAADKGPVAFVF
jgi:hypothetical protein